MVVSMTLSLAFVATPWLLFFWQLMSEYQLNPVYQFGLLAPLILGALIYFRAEGGVAMSPPVRTRLLDTGLVIGFLLLIPLHLLFEANADWRLIQWLQGILSAGLTLGILYRWGGWPMLRHYGALALIPLLCIPWPTGLEKWLGTHLMSAIASASVEMVHWLGYEANRAGNLIFLPNGTTVGVEEACSGLRSLAGNLFAAGVIGELLLLQMSGRWTLLALAIPLALIFNFLRSLILVVTAATSGSQWALLLHDSAGWSILIVSFVALYGLGKLFPSEVKRPISTAKISLSALPMSLTVAGLALLGIIVMLGFVYYPRAALPVKVSLQEPSALGLPENVKNKDAERFQTLLFYNTGESWRWNDEAGDWQLFYFSWSSPRLSRLGGAYHRPERCLPNTGWTLQGAPREIMLEVGQNIKLPATLTHFEDAGGRSATLLFAHWGNDLNDIGLDTRLDPAERWQDFLARRRLDQRTALQMSIISSENSSELDEKIVAKAKRFLTTEKP